MFKKPGILFILCLTTQAFLICADVLAHDYCQTPTTKSTVQSASSSVESAWEDLPILTEKQVLSATQTGVEAGFGRTISLDGNTLAIGSTDKQNETRGFVDIFYLQNNQWQHIKTLKSPIEQAYEYFWSVVLDEDTLLVSARGYCQTGPQSDCQQGLVYVYDRNEGGADNWGLVQQLDGGFKTPSRFGQPLALDGNTAAVMATQELVPGSEHEGVVYIFEKGFIEPGQWGLVKRLESSAAMNLDQGYSGDGLKIKGDSILQYGFDQSGSVINEFSRNEGGAENWGLAQQIFFPAIRLKYSAFDGETLALHFEDDCIPSEDRKQYLVFYNKDPQGVWKEQQQFEINDSFQSAAVEGQHFLVSASDGTVGYLLQRDSALDSWEFKYKLMASDPSMELDDLLITSMDSGRALVADSFENNVDGTALFYVTAPPINAGHAGAWFNAATSGQGQLIDVEPERQFIFLAWFTYTPADSDNPFEQHWFTTQGNYIGNKAELIVYETLGGKFDDPQAVNTDAVGTATLSFTNCGLGQMNYTIDTLGLSGSFPLQRAIQGSDNICQQRQVMTTQSVDINGGMDGAWFDENTPGQGFLIDAHPNPEGGNFIFVAWFTYGEDTTSGQRWLTAQGNFEGSTAAIDVYETTGGSFDDSQVVSTNKAGTMTIDFQDCSNALLSYELTDEALSNSIAISRAIPGAQALCEELAAAD